MYEETTWDTKIKALSTHGEFYSNEICCYVDAFSYTFSSYNENSEFLTIKS